MCVIIRTMWCTLEKGRFRKLHLLAMAANCVYPTPKGQNKWVFWQLDKMQLGIRYGEQVTHQAEVLLRLDFVLLDGVAVCFFTVVRKTSFHC